MRATTQYIISGTKFIRLASRKLLGEYGTNLQNIEKADRKMYHADPGMLLNQRDQSGAEALIVAYLCRYGQFRELFLNGIKPHVFVALHLFPEEWQRRITYLNLDIKCDISELINTAICDLKKNPFWKPLDKLIKSSDEWPPSERFYYIAKQVCHSSNYGITANPFCLNTLEKSLGKIVLKKKQAEYFLDMYHGLFPEIREWHADTEKQVMETGMLFDLFGGPIIFTDDMSSNRAMKEAFSAVPQRTVAEITNMAVVQSQNFIEDSQLNWDVLANTHDSFVVQAPEAECVMCQQMMKQYIEPELTSFRGEKFKMKSEGGTGFNWAPYHEEKNPLGLKEAA